MNNVNAKKKLVPPYSYLAEYYDLVMSHVNYRRWGSYIRLLLHRADRAVKRIIDCSCGTGNIFPHIRGFRRKLYGMDFSAHMLRKARLKKQNLPLLCGDFTALPLRDESFDAILVLYDSLNYLCEEEQVVRFFGDTYRVLRPGGVLIFDIVTPFLCRTAFRNYHESLFLDDENGYERWSFFDLKESIQVNRFRIFYERQEYMEEHRQKIRPIEQWMAYIRTSEFKVAGVFSNFTLKPVHESSERAHFVLKKSKG